MSSLPHCSLLVQLALSSPGNLLVQLALSSPGNSASGMKLAPELRAFPGGSIPAQQYGFVRLAILSGNIVDSSTALL